ncbi:MAG: four helix bundle protein [Acidobacteriota bacterium]
MSRPMAEGHQRQSTTDYLRFLNIAAGSRGELETQLLLAQTLGYLAKDDADGLIAACEQVAKLLAALTRALRAKLRADIP